MCAVNWRVGGVAVAGGYRVFNMAMQFAFEKGSRRSSLIKV